VAKEDLIAVKLGNVEAADRRRDGLGWLRISPGCQRLRHEPLSLDIHRVGFLGQLFDVGVLRFWLGSRHVVFTIAGRVVVRLVRRHDDRVNLEALA
jgi:hypothetical protein